MTKDEALKMALETLEVWKGYMTHLWDKTDEHTMVAIKEALAQPEQRTWVHLTNEEHTELAIEWGCLSADWVFYAASVERKVKEKNS